MNRERWAQLGIVAQFLALVRTLGEYFRLKHGGGSQFSVSAVEPFVRGALVDAALCFIAVLLFFFKQYRSAFVVSLLTIAILLVYKIYLMGWI